MLCLAPHFAADVLGPVIAAYSYIFKYISEKYIKRRLKVYFSIFCLK